MATGKRACKVKVESRVCVCVCVCVCTYTYIHIIGDLSPVCSYARVLRTCRIVYSSCMPVYPCFRVCTSVRRAVDNVILHKLNYSTTQICGVRSFRDKDFSEVLPSVCAATTRDAFSLHNIKILIYKSPAREDSAKGRLLPLL